MQVLNTIFLNSMRRARTFGLLCVALLGMNMTVPPQRDQPSREYQLKAVFLYNFTQFVEWPTGAFQTADEPLIIGILGKDPFGKYLDQTVFGEKLDEHPFEVRRFGKVGDIKACHILFVNVTDTNTWDEVFALAGSKHILTVGDAENFASAGGMIRFFTENGKTRIRINLESAKNASLTISSKLLRLAEITPQNH
jgi:hypothetical protein